MKAAQMTLEKLRIQSCKVDGCEHKVNHYYETDHHKHGDWIIGHGMYLCNQHSFEYKANLAVWLAGAR